MGGSEVLRNVVERWEKDSENGEEEKGVHLSYSSPCAVTNQAIEMDEMGNLL